MEVRVSVSTTRAISNAIESGRPLPRHRGAFAGSVYETFVNYKHQVSRICDANVDDADSWHVFPKYPPNGPCYSYLFLAAELPSSRIYKVGITHNVAQRFSQFCAGIPPIFSPRRASILLFGSSLWASLCEESVLVHCRHLWVGGEWLLESKEATDGR
jgi:hypothetical protein